jgi:MarR family transcriptional regulator, 2-MHQ and catechol-resistance regulon repressor
MLAGMDQATTAPALPAELVDRLDDDRITAYGLLIEAHRRLSQTFERSAETRLGSSTIELEVLLRVGRSPDGRLRMTELAGQLGLTSGGVTRLVDRVTTDGYVERTACPSDRRVQWVVLTAAGQRKLGEVLDVHLDELQREFVDRLTPDEMHALTGALDKLRTP